MKTIIATLALAAIACAAAAQTGWPQPQQPQGAYPPPVVRPPIQPLQSIDTRPLATLVSCEPVTTAAGQFMFIGKYTLMGDTYVGNFSGYCPFSVPVGPR